VTVTAVKALTWGSARRFAGVEELMVENAGEPLLPVGWAPAQVVGDELAAVAVDQREEGGCRVVAAAACPEWPWPMTRPTSACWVR
jgi:hypothetical protein